MENLFITNWNEFDSANFYAYQATHRPLIYSIEHNLWVSNSYDCCKSILNSEHTRVLNPAKPEGLNEKAELLLNNLARINNGETHHHARTAALMIYDVIKSVDICGIIDVFLSEVDHTSFDWVNVICKRLPVYVIAKGLSFDDQECDWLVEHMPELIKIMSPAKTAEDVEVINNVVEHYYTLAAKYISNDTLTNRLVNTLGYISRQEATDLLICNLLGMFIQSFDACRALLTISVTTLAKLHREQRAIKSDEIFYKKFINEILRIDPPVHTTRRIAIQDIHFGNVIIKEGENILVVMGAANMDHRTFDTPEKFDIERVNNMANLTFGLGGHACIAKFYCINMAIATTRYLVDKFGSVRIVQPEIIYESQLNVKMAKQLFIAL